VATLSRRHLCPYTEAKGPAAMEELSKLHRDVPYGWVLVVGALWRMVVRRRQEHQPVATRDRLAGGLNQLSHPH
jgi:hypothetical protein